MQITAGKGCGQKPKARLSRTRHCLAQYHAEESLGLKLDQNAGWFGFARLTELLPVTFFAPSSNAQRVCALSGVGNVKY